VVADNICFLEGAESRLDTWLIAATGAVDVRAAWGGTIAFAKLASFTTAPCSHHLLTGYWVREMGKDKRVA
jgi:hypothetical protein